jgi:hypothetical protein
MNDLHTITVVCMEPGYPEPLIYAVAVRDPQDMEEAQEAVRQVRKADGVEGEIFACFAFAGEIEPIADWRI